MPNQFTKPLEITEFGPAMKALLPMQQAFVLAYCTSSEGNATKAAKEAGYSNNTNAISVQAYRLTHRPDVLAAIREMTVARVSAGLPVYVEALEKVAKNVQHKDQVKAIGMLLNRGGMPDVREINHNVVVTVTRAEKEAEIRQMAEELGMDPEKLLGTVTEAEYEEIPNGLEDIW